MSEHSGKGDWRLHALCHGEVDLPFAKPHTTEVRDFIDEFCGNCPVASECLEFALRVEAPLPVGLGRYGVFGGFTGAERVGMAKRGVRTCVVCFRLFVPIHRRNTRCPRHVVDGVVDGDGREHGSERGLAQHRQRGEPPCDLCRGARNAADRERRSAA